MGYYKPKVSVSRPIAFLSPVQTGQFERPFTHEPWISAREADPELVRSCPFTPIDRPLQTCSHVPEILRIL